MRKSTPMDRVAFKAMVYILLAGGSVIFCWPLLWMAGTSMKMDKELFNGKLRLSPVQPLAREKSPYVDERAFEGKEGKRKDELLKVLEAHIATFKGVWPEDVDRASMNRVLAIGAYDRLLNMLPTPSWGLSPAELQAEALKLTDEAMVKSLSEQARKSLLIGQLRARSYDIQEDQLMSSADAAKDWVLEGSAEAFLAPVTANKQTNAELHYDFAKGSIVRLSKTFKLSFKTDRLYRLQLSLKGDEAWHPVKAYVEMKGKRYESAKDQPISDANWTVITWQEPGPDDLSNKIRTWISLVDTGESGSFENGPNSIKVTIEMGDAGAGAAWWYKIKRNYELVFANMPFWRYTATSVFLVVINLIGTLFSCSIVAYAFSRMRWPGRSMSYAVMLGTMMVPQQVTMIPFFLIVRYLDWYNTLYPLWVGSFFAGAFNVFLLHQFFKGIPTDLEDAAKIDGCGPLRIYWFIMLPLIKPALATITIFTFMGVWKDFMGPLIYLSDQRLYPLSLGLYALNVQAGGSMSMMMAGSLLMILPVVTIFFFAQRYFIEGITMTGLKS